MRHLFVVRHGNYDPHTGDLDDLGKTQITTITEQMRAICGTPTNQFYLFSSPTPRASQSANIIAATFGIQTYETSYALDSGLESASQTGLEQIDLLVAPQKERDIIAIATHMEVAAFYPSHFMRTVLGLDVEIPMAKKGEAIHVDLEQGAYKLLTSKRY